MAVKGKVENEYGAKFEYHKLRNVTISNGSNGIQLVMTVDSYLDKQARIEGKAPTTRECIISGADFAMQPFYALLKAKFPEFNNLEDDLNNDFKGGSYQQKPEYTEQSSDYSMTKSWKEQE